MCQKSLDPGSDMLEKQINYCKWDQISEDSIRVLVTKLKIALKLFFGRFFTIVQDLKTVKINYAKWLFSEMK